MKAVQLWFNSILPEDLRDYSRKFDLGSLNDLMVRVKKEYPDQFRDISQKISDVGRHLSYRQGETLSLKDLAPVIDKKSLLGEMDKEIEEAKKADPDNFQENKRKIWQQYSDLISSKTSEAALKNGNSIATAVLSGARGKKPQLQAMLSTPMTYSDYKDEVIDKLITRSYAEGSRPADMLAGSFGARNSVISTKSSTAKGGDLSKQMFQTVSDMVIRANNCGTRNGILMKADDDDLKGRFLARDIAGHKAGTPIDSRTLKDIRKAGVEDLIVRSPMTCQEKDGLCSDCVGYFYNGGQYPKIGEHIGATVSTTIGDPITQGALNCLHATTEVRMGDGTKREIQHLLPGDTVLGADKEGNTFPVEVRYVFCQWEKATWCWEFRREGRLSTEMVRATKNHKVLVYGAKGYKVKPLGKMLHDDRIVYGDGSAGKLAHRCCGMRVLCYDIEVDHQAHLFVLANGMIVSNSKHQSGMTQGKQEYSGFDVVNQLVQSPEVFKDKATVADLDGKVESIEVAPQGGHYIKVGGASKYVPQGFDILVKEGDDVEAGDQLSDGVVDPEDIVRTLGIGEGRMSYARNLEKVLKASGFGTSRRNVEVLARNAINHVRIDSPEGMGDYLPDDIVSYNRIQADYIPPEETKGIKLDQAIGKILQVPALHYSIGTKITPKVARNLKKAGESEVYVSDTEPEFVPEMVRMRTASHINTDWLASLGTSYLKGQLNTAATRGDDTNIEKNINYGPRLAVGKGFGEDTGKTGEF